MLSYSLCLCTKKYYARIKIVLTDKELEIMSQEKVNRYKEEKANRKQTMAKEKRKKGVQKVAGILVAVVIVGWVGYSAVDAYQSGQPREQVEVDYTAVSDYLQTLN